jgi:hypothetical protein
MNWNNGKYEEHLKEPVDGSQTAEERDGEKLDWQGHPLSQEAIRDNFELKEEMVNVPVDAMQTVDVIHEENIELKEPVALPKVMETGPLPWLKGEENDELRTRWNLIQSEFVNEPRTSVEQADALVAETLDRIQQAFSKQRTVLNEQWASHADISTEDLRIALQSYRSFFNRLLAL